MAISRYLVLGVLFYVFALALTVPVPLVLQWSGQTEHVPAPLEGTVWRGHGGPLDAGQLTIRRVDWRWDATGLLFGEWRYAVDAASAQGNAAGYAGWSPLSGAMVSDLRVPASLMGPAIGPLTPAMAGELILNLDGVELANGLPVTGEGDLRWANAAVDLGERLDLGDILLTIEAGEQGLKGLISNEGGLLALEGNATFNGRRYQLNLMLKPRGQISADMRRLLDRTLRREGGGYRLARVGVITN